MSATPRHVTSRHVTSPTTAVRRRRAWQVQRYPADRSQRGPRVPDLLVAAACGDLRAQARRSGTGLPRKVSQDAR
ncbi:MAG: hypothetical protein M0Z95_09890 [Actinomycetota bacterium]|nr:hypothetical protein [Actinomycetota bacterium]